MTNLNHNIICLSFNLMSILTYATKFIVKHIIHNVVVDTKHVPMDIFTLITGLQR